MSNIYIVLGVSFIKHPRTDYGTSSERKAVLSMVIGISLRDHPSRELIRFVDAMGLASRVSDRAKAGRNDILRRNAIRRSSRAAEDEISNTIREALNIFMIYYEEKKKGFKSCLIWKDECKPL